MDRFYVPRFVINEAKTRNQPLKPKIWDYECSDTGRKTPYLPVLATHELKIEKLEQLSAKFFLMCFFLSTIVFELFLHASLEYVPLKHNSEFLPNAGHIKRYGRLLF